MMMRSCETGGMDVRYRVTEFEMQKMHDDFDKTGYAPNPFGFYEGVRLDYKEDDIENVLVKVFAFNLESLPVVNGLVYKIAFMVRPDEEILMSYHRAWPEQEEPNIVSLEYAKEVISQRPDFDVTYLNYHDVVNNPIKEFTKLKEAGWPIDVEKTATVPTPELYRNRL
jgi:hypothetical protein